MINYSKLANNYRPDKIKTLLVGEAPPQSGKSYFYLPVDKVHPGSLPGTVFIHYFGILPQSKKEYAYFLDELKRRGIWMIDITNVPENVWLNKRKWEKNEEAIQRIANQLPKLKQRISDLGVNEKDVIILLARNDYASKVRALFPNSVKTSWSKFRNG